MVFFGGFPVSGLVTPISEDSFVYLSTTAFAASIPLPPAAALVAEPPAAVVSAPPAAVVSAPALAAVVSEELLLSLPHPAATSAAAVTAASSATRPRPLLMDPPSSPPHVTRLET